MATSMSVRSSIADEDGNYRIEVVDFGPILSADVDLRPLTVFAGPSNTGKSYLAMLVYALHQCFGPPYLPSARPRRPPYWFAGPMVRSLPNHDAVAMRVADWFAGGSESELAPLPADLTTDLRPALEQVSGAEECLEQEVRRCFGVDALDDLLRQGSPETGAVITLHIPRELGRERVRYRFEFGPKRVAVSGRFASLPKLSSELFEGQNFFPGFVDLDAAPSLLSAVLEALFQALIRPLIRNAYYLPADRTGVMHSHHLVISTLIHRATAAGLRRSADAPLLSGVLADFLDGLISTSQLPRSLSHNCPTTWRRICSPAPSACSNRTPDTRRSLIDQPTGTPIFRSYAPLRWYRSSHPWCCICVSWYDRATC